MSEQIETSNGKIDQTPAVEGLEQPAAMSVAEAGRKGGQTTAARRGTEFYREIGRKGGVATAEAHGAEFYSTIGRKGGESRADDLDVRSGALGRKGAQARWGAGDKPAPIDKHLVAGGPKRAKPEIEAAKRPVRKATSGD